MLILTTNTEVAVAPKLHKRGDTATKHSDELSLPSEIEAENSKGTLPSHKSCVLRVLPARLSPSLPGYAGPDLLAFVSPETLSHLQIEDVNLGSSTFLRVVQRRLLPPPDPSSSNSDRPDPSIEQPAPRVLHAGGRDQVNQTQDTKSTEGVYLGITNGIVTSHIVFPVLPKGVEDWDIVRYLRQIELPIYLFAQSFLQHLAARR